MLRSALIEAGLKDVAVDEITEHTEFKSGAALWQWIVWSNPIVETILGSVNVTGDERRTIEQAMNTRWAERAGSSSIARLAAPINIGWGTK
jgi:hypothetical protein